MGLLDGSIGASTLALLFLCLAIALGFEFVNGFHDTANAVATVIYTRSLKPWKAVVWSGLLNFLGVLFGGVAVAFSIVHLLPVDLLINIGQDRGPAHGALAAAFRHYLEFWDLVLWAAVFELSRVDRFDPWRRTCQFAFFGPGVWNRRKLDEGARSDLIPLDLAAGRLLPGRRTLAVEQGFYPRSPSLSGTEE